MATLKIRIPGTTVENQPVDNTDELAIAETYVVTPATRSGPLVPQAGDAHDFLSVGMDVEGVLLLALGVPLKEARNGDQAAFTLGHLGMIARF